MKPHLLLVLPLIVLVALSTLPSSGQQPGTEKLYPDPLNVEPPHISTDRSVKYDFDIVYVRMPRKGDDSVTHWTEIAHPALMEPGADLMLLHPDGSEEVLIRGGEDGAVTDPAISFDGEWVYYSHLQGLAGTSQHGVTAIQGADIYKIHVKTRKTIRLTRQQFTPNTGAAMWATDLRKPEQGKTHLPYGVLNMGPCPVPGGKVVFTSNRNAFRPPNGYPTVTLQLFIMDDDGANVECIGHLNLAGALHPTVLTDGRVVFSSLESQGLRSSILWGIWSIHPDGTNWGPVVSALLPGGGAPNAFHFQTQLSDGSLIVEEYYNQNNWGFGAYFRLPPQAPDGYPPFGPALMSDLRNPPLRFGRFNNARGKYARLPFSPHGIESFTRFANNGEGPADPSVRDRKDSPAVGKFTHPSGAPDNHLLTVWSPGPVNHQYRFLPMVDGGIYLIKDGKAIDEPGQMRLIKNDPKYNEQWPRALVPYKRIHSIDEPKRLPALANDGTRSKHLPEGTPFGLVGTSSLYKRESFPQGAVPEGKVTATFTGKVRNAYRGLDIFNSAENGQIPNWVNQGADAGLYENDQIHALRILVMDPTTDRRNGPGAGRPFRNFANERLRILGEIPVRKFDGNRQPTDPDGNPDTSFLAKIPADTAFTFQTLDKNGMVLNMAQTWHQLRPGEIRNDCGGCHAHSQKPTPFEKTAASRADYPLFDLTGQTPLLTTRAKDESGKKWDTRQETGLRFETGIKEVEFHRDVKPILQRSCVACHSHKAEKPAGNLVLDDETLIAQQQGPRLPGTYFRLAADSRAQFGHKPVNDRYGGANWRKPNASRYVRMFQSRRSLLIWKVYGERLDGWSNDDFPTETVPGDATTLQLAGQPVPKNQQNIEIADLDFTGSAMPPPEAVASTYEDLHGKKVKVEPLTDEDRRTLVRWIDLGCPIDLDPAYSPDKPAEKSHGSLGWMLDDNRPTLTLTYPRTGKNNLVERLLVGMNDHHTGIDPKSFRVSADFALDGVPAGQDLAEKFREKSPGVWELRLDKPLSELARGTVTVSVKDRQGNEARIERCFSVGK